MVKLSVIEQANFMDTDRSRSGLTLVEMLVATTLTLILFFAVAELFAQLGSVMQDGRAIIELSGELRSVAYTLQRDLDNRTAEVLPWVKPGSNQGYFEIVEGPDRNRDFLLAASNGTISASNANGIDGITFGGDADDIMSFTVYSKDEPFVGIIHGTLNAYPAGVSNQYKYYIDRYQSRNVGVGSEVVNDNTYTAITSHYAEVVYWTRCTANDDQNILDPPVVNQRDPDETVTVYRRVFLIRPDIDMESYYNLTTSLPERHNPSLSHEVVRKNYDISVRPFEVTGVFDSWRSNSLEDLQERFNRAGHFTINAGSLTPDPTPTAFNGYPLRPEFLPTFEELEALSTYGVDRTGQDVILSKALAFDVRVFDPTAQLISTGTSSSVVISPGDVGYEGVAAAVGTGSIAVVGQGSYVDLGWRQGTTTANTFSSTFSENPTAKSNLNAVTSAIAAEIPSLTGGGNFRTYDTWPYYYEVDGGDQNNDGATDEGTNGFDDNANNIIDDLTEYETLPPYVSTLRGVSVQVRAYEPGTRQVRQDTIMADFLPE